MLVFIVLVFDEVSFDELSRIHSSHMQPATALTRLRICANVQPFDQEP